MAAEKKLELILHKNGRGSLDLWACRGAGRGCKRNSTRERKKLCDDCFGPLDPKMTIGQVHDRLQKGDA